VIIANSVVLLIGCWFVVALFIYFSCNVWFVSLCVTCVYIGYLIAMFCLCVFLVCFGVWFYCIARVLRIRLKFGGCLFACGVIVLR